jgi:hypothetical protein
MAQQPISTVWRVLRDGQPTALLIHLEDSADLETAQLVLAAARRQGVELEPVWPEDVELTRPAPAT